jgi:diacylglycerol kinase (ATP)
MRATTLASSFRCAFAGLWYVIRTQRNAKIHLAAGVLVLIAGVVFRIGSRDWGILALAIGLVLSVEIVNTVFETMVDLFSPELHPLARIAKDVAAAAVLCAAAAALAAGLFILVPAAVQWWRGV